jgi:hypothetical protein
MSTLTTVLAACGSEQAATPFESSEASNEVTFEVKKGEKQTYRIQPSSNK